jgi:hypothetical protein
MSLRGVLIGLLAVCASTELPAQQIDPYADAEGTPWFRQTAENNKFAVIVTGAAASDEIRSRFRNWSVDLYDSLLQDFAYADDQVFLLLDDGANVGQARSRVSGSSRVSDVESTLRQVRALAGDGDQVTLFMIGHGSGTFGETKFNNVGPDMTGSDLAGMLEIFDNQDLVVINTTSASFEFSRALSALGRVIVSATRSPAERYDPVFAGFFIEGLKGHRADLDRNGRVSVLEAFNYASNSVAAWYREQGRLATENAVLDDTGDGLFSREPGTSQSDGMLAEIAYFDMISLEQEKTSPMALQLKAEMQTLERDIFILRNQKQNYLEEDYWNRLEALLIDLAIRTRRYNESP